MEGMEEDQLVKKIMESERRGGKWRGKPQMGCMEDVKRALNA